MAEEPKSPLSSTRKIKLVRHPMFDKSLATITKLNSGKVGIPSMSLNNLLKDFKCKITEPESSQTSDNVPETIDVSDDEDSNLFDNTEDIHLNEVVVYERSSPSSPEFQVVETTSELFDNEDIKRTETSETYEDSLSMIKIVSVTSGHDIFEEVASVEKTHSANENIKQFVSELLGNLLDRVLETQSPHENKQPDNENSNTIDPASDATSNFNGVTCEDTDEPTETDEGSSNLNLEEIRENLKLQLSSLRMRKNHNIIEKVSSSIYTDKDMNNMQYSVKDPPKAVKLVSKINDANSSSLLNNETAVDNSKEISSMNLDSFISNPNIEIDWEDEEGTEPNVFMEIRKIINKKKTNPVKRTETGVRSEPISSSCDNSSDNIAVQSPKEVSSTEKVPLRTPQNNDETTPEKSPFVSNTLEEFLNHSKLNVSYTIPKSAAEEGLKKNYTEVPTIPLVVKLKEDSDTDRIRVKNEYKPKTLAEKRKILEKKQLQENGFKKPATKANSKSYIMYKNKKIFLRSRSASKCIAAIESDNSINIVKKPSLLREMVQKEHNVKYKPGPLSKKHLLQVDQTHWVTGVKPLPKVILSVQPEVGKPIHPKLVPHIFNYNLEVSDKQLDFALSMLPSAEKSFLNFDINYENNQTDINVRKRSIIPAVQSELDDENENNVEGVVGHVVRDLLDFVDRKDIFSLIDIKYDDDVNITSERSLKDDILMGPKKRNYKKKSRTSRELLRLNCKLVTVDDQIAQDKACTKPYCQLGCVCDSLQCNTMIGLHCGKPACFFKCTCPTEPSPTVHLGTGFLSRDTVTRIENQAKRDMAKEERYFTQTVIYANNNTIVVGPSNKQRRAARAPKKYDDYMEDEDFEKYIEKPTTKESLMKPCFVDLVRYEFDDIIPYCLRHNLYDCHCKGLSPLLNKVEEPKTEDIVFAVTREEKIVEQCQKKKQPRRHLTHHPVEELVELQTSKPSQVQFPESRTTHKRKQQLVARQEVPIATPKQSVLETSKIQSVFKGEIIVNDAKWMNKFCSGGERLQNYCRILPWKDLLIGFYQRTINVYGIGETPLRLVLNVGPKLIGPNIYDIYTHKKKALAYLPSVGKSISQVNQSQHVRCVIKWLLTKELPPDYTTSPVSFLLVEAQRGQFEMRGICTQNIKEVPQQETSEEISNTISEVKHKNMLNRIVSVFISRSNYPMRELYKEGVCADLLHDNMSITASLPEVANTGKWRMLHLKNNFDYLYLKKVNYSMKYSDLMKLAEIAKTEKTTLRIYNSATEKYQFNPLFGLYITAEQGETLFIGPYPLDHIEEDIDTFQIINKSPVSSQLMLHMKSKSLQIGHWFYERCAENVENPVEISHPLEQQPIDNSAKTKQVMPPLQKKPENIETIYDYLLPHKDFQIRVKNKRPRLPTEFNRFIITNIPNFGYLGAYQEHATSPLEVSWPFEKKVLEFENADNARDFLQDRFNLLLQPVPETFKIQVIVLFNLKLNEHKPINTDNLHGQCICGEFGIYKLKSLTDEFCREQLNVSKAEIIALFTKKSQTFMRNKLNELANLTGIDINNATCTVDSILKKSVEEIKSLEQQRREYVTKVYNEEVIVVEQFKKLYTMIKTLPSKRRSIESRVMREILQLRPKRSVIAKGVIVIPDDDNETSNVAGTNDKGIEKVAKKRNQMISTDVDCSASKISKTEPSTSHSISSQSTLSHAR